MIHIEGLGKLFGSNWAVRDLDLRIEAGTFFTFLGPNGAGKTTTMKMMTGLLRPTTGAVRIAGIDVMRDPVAAKAKIGYIPDHPFLYGKLTGREFLRFVGGLHRMAPEDVRRGETDLLAAFDLEPEADRRIDGYSHGTRQRLAFAACFLHGPEAVIIDEPWVGLDPRNIRTAIEFLKGRVREGTTIFMSTHSLGLAEEIAERIGIICKGRLIYDGTSAGLRERSGRDLEEAFLELTEGPDGRLEA
jgi:ABC-2 type transport system ATP-binding protein